MNTRVELTPHLINTAPLGELMATFVIDGQVLPSTAEAAAALVKGFVFADSLDSEVKAARYDTDPYADSARLGGIALGYEWNGNKLETVTTNFDANFHPDGFWKGIIKRITGGRPETSIYIIPMLRHTDPGPDEGNGPKQPKSPGPNTGTRTLVQVG